MKFICMGIVPDHFIVSYIWTRFLLFRFLVSEQIDQDCHRQTVHHEVARVEFGHHELHSTVVVTIHVSDDPEASFGMWIWPVTFPHTDCIVFSVSGA